MKRETSPMLSQAVEPRQAVINFRWAGPVPARSLLIAESDPSRAWRIDVVRAQVRTLELLLSQALLYAEPDPPHQRFIV